MEVLFNGIYSVVARVDSNGILPGSEVAVRRHLEPFEGTSRKHAPKKNA